MIEETSIEVRIFKCTTVYYVIGSIKNEHWLPTKTTKSVIITKQYSSQKQKQLLGQKKLEYMGWENGCAYQSCMYSKNGNNEIYAESII